MDEFGTEPDNIEFDNAKRARILAERGIDLAEAPLVFAGFHMQIVDDRKDYGELRLRVFGFLNGRRVALVWTPRNGKRRIITMRYAHHDEHESRIRTLD